MKIHTKMFFFLYKICDEKGFEIFGQLNNILKILKEVNI